MKMEFVEQTREKLVEEMECMESLGIFTEKEITALGKERTELLYKLQRRDRSIEDTLAYVNYELDLITKIADKRKKQNIYSYKGELEISMSYRVHSILLNMVQNHPHDVELWMKYFEFCKKYKYMMYGRNNLDVMLNYHSEKENLYVFASRWEVECDNKENAHLWLCKGLAVHPKSELLTKELILNILSNLEEFAVNKDEENDDKVIAQMEFWNKSLERSFVKAQSSITHVDFYIDLLKSVMYNPRARKLRELILSDLREHFPNKEETWDMLARYEMISGELMVADAEEDTEILEKAVNCNVKGQILKAISVYEEGASRLNTRRMWDYYLDWLNEVCNSAEKFPLFTTKCLKQALEAAEVAKRLTTRHYIQYVKLLEGQNGKSKRLSVVLERATEAFPHFPLLWYHHVKYYICKQSEQNALRIFRKALDSLADIPAAEIVPLYEMFMTYYSLKDNSKCDELFLKALKGRSDLARLLKPIYLKWKFHKQGISGARKVVELPDPAGIPILEVYKLMAEFEAMQTEPSLSKIRRWHECMINDFGLDNVEVWLKFISFEIRMGDPGRVPLIYERAKKNLRSSYLDVFLQRYELVFEPMQRDVVTCVE